MKINKACMSDVKFDKHVRKRELIDWLSTYPGSNNIGRLESHGSRLPDIGAGGGFDSEESGKRVVGFRILDHLPSPPLLLSLSRNLVVIVVVIVFVVIVRVLSVTALPRGMVENVEFDLRLVMYLCVVGPSGENKSMTKISPVHPPPSRARIPINFRMTQWPVCVKCAQGVRQ